MNKAIQTNDGWFKGTRSGHAGACVEGKRNGNGVVEIRDSKLPEGAPRLIQGSFSELRAFIADGFGG